MGGGRDRFAAACLVLGVALATVFLVVVWMEGRGSLGDDVPPGAIRLQGVEPAGSGVYRSVETPDRFHMIARSVGMTPHRDYEVRFTVMGAPTESVTLHVDFFGPDFDDPQSETRLAIEWWKGREPVSVRLPVAEAPPSAFARIFYEGAAGLEISDVRIRHFPTWVSRARAGFGWGAILLGGFALLLLVLNDRSTVWLRLAEAAPSRGFGIAVIFVLYAVGVVMRFLLYDATPSWAGDEYIYKAIAGSIWEFGTNAAILPTHVAGEVDLPNPIYPYVIAPAFAWGDDFYPAIRAINSLLMNAAIFPAYAIAIRFWPIRWAIPIALFAICIPAMALGAYAVTEVLFYPAYLTVAWAAIRAVPKPGAVGPAVLVGLTAALAMNVRATGVTTLPAYLLALVVFALLVGNVRALVRRPAWLAAPVVFGVVNAALQSFLRTASDGTAVGLYGVLLKNDHLSSMWNMVMADPAGPARLLLGHVLTFAIPYAVPVALFVVAAPSLRRMFVETEAEEELGLVLVASAFALSLFSMVIAFSLWVAPIEPAGPDRWHGRYYFVIYPLVLMGAAAIGRRANSAVRRRAVFGAGIVLAVGAWALFGSSIPQATWFASIVDNMGLHWDRYWPRLYVLFAALTLGAAVAWAAERLVGLRVFVASLVLWLATASYATSIKVRVGEDDWRFACGRGLAGLVSGSDARFAVLGVHRPNFVGLGFWIPRTPTLTRRILPGKSVDEILAPLEPVDLVLVSGTSGSPTGATLVRESDDCRAYAMPGGSLAP